MYIYLKAVQAKSNAMEVYFVMNKEICLIRRRLVKLHLKAFELVLQDISKNGLKSILFNGAIISIFFFIFVFTTVDSK